MKNYFLIFSLLVLFIAFPGHASASSPFLTPTAGFSVTLSSPPSGGQALTPTMISGTYNSSQVPASGYICMIPWIDAPSWNSGGVSHLLATQVSIDVTNSSFAFSPNFLCWPRPASNSGSFAYNYPFSLAGHTVGIFAMALNVNGRYCGAGANAPCYYLNQGVNQSFGPISFTAVATIPNNPPTATISSPTGNPYTATIGTSIMFYGMATDPDSGDSVTGYEWRNGSCSSGTVLSTNSLFFKGDLSIGSYNIYFRAKDSHNAWSPCAMVTVVVSSPPDLSAGVTSVMPNPATTGQSTKLSAIFSNAIGGATATNFPNIFNITTTRRVWGILRTVNVATVDAGTIFSLAPGASSAPLSGFYIFQTPGIYSVQACADNNINKQGTIVESIESNNCGPSTSVTVSNSPINGSCSSPAVHYSCASGTSINNAESASAYTWTCAGLNNGVTAFCSEAKYPCATTTIGNCALPSTVSGSSAGACRSNYSGVCSYLCTNGTWNIVSNTCEALVSKAPTAIITTPAVNRTVTPGTAVTFSGSGTVDNSVIQSNYLTNFEWRDGSCTAGTAISTSSYYSNSTFTLGTHTMYLKVKDYAGNWSTNCPSITVTVAQSQSPTATITTPSANQSIVLGTRISFSGSGTADTSIDPYNYVSKYEWRDGSCSTGPTLGTTYSFSNNTFTLGTHQIYLRVQDKTTGNWSTNCPSRTITVSKPPAVNLKFL